MSEIKFCKDCKYIIPDSDGKMQFAKCWHINASQTPSADGEYFVEGKKGFTYCSVIRKFPEERYCGPDARWFEAKPIEKEPGEIGATYTKLGLVKRFFRKLNLSWR